MAINVPPNRSALAALLVASAERLREAGEVAEAKRLLIRAVKADPTNAQAGALLATLQQAPPSRPQRFMRWAGNVLLAPPVILAFISFLLLNMLGAWVSHYYWREQQNFEREKVLLDRKIALTTTASGLLTRYLNTLKEAEQLKKEIEERSKRATRTNRRGQSGNQGLARLNTRLQALRQRQKIAEEKLAGLLTQVNGYFGSKPAGLSIQWDNRRKAKPLDLEGLEEPGNEMLSAMLAEIREPPRPTSFWRFIVQIWR